MNIFEHTTLVYQLINEYKALILWWLHVVFALSFQLFLSNCLFVIVCFGICCFPIVSFQSFLCNLLLLIISFQLFLSTCFF